MRLPALLLLAVLLVLAGAGGWWKSTASPLYALGQVRAAYQAHDLKPFCKYLDLPGVVSSLLDDIHARPERRAAGHGLGLLLGLSQDLAQDMRPGLVLDVVAEVERRVELHSDQNPIEGWVQAGEASLRREGRLAFVRLSIRPEPEADPLPVVLLLRDVGSFWQVAKVVNTGEILTELAKRGKEGRPEQAGLAREANPATDSSPGSR